MLIYAFGTKEDGSKICDGTVGRIRVALEYIYDKGGAWTIILGAGKDPGRRHRPALKELMSEHISSCLYYQGFIQLDGKEFSNGKALVTIRLADRDSWGTFLETLAMVKVLQEDPRPGVIVVASSAFHMRRIQLIWKFFPYTVEPVCYNSPRPKRDIFWETLKLAKVLYCGIRYKLGMLN